MHIKPHTWESKIKMSVSYEILFRGERLDNGEWAYGSLWIDNWQDGRPCHIIDVEDYLVIPSTVGQYTGLTDKNGVKIFEGDIVSGCDFPEEEGYAVVQWCRGAFIVCGRKFVGSFYDSYPSYELEVIGNIHDNPELLEGGHEP